MSTTNTDNLGLAYIASGQKGKEITANTALRSLDLALCGTLAVPLTTGSNFIMTLTQGRLANFLLASGANTGGATITLPAVNRTYVVVNGYGGTITLTGGSGATCTVASGLHAAAKIAYVNGDVYKL